MTSISAFSPRAACTPSAVCKEFTTKCAEAGIHSFYRTLGADLYIAFLDKQKRDHSFTEKDLRDGLTSPHFNQGLQNLFIACLKKVYPDWGTPVSS